MAGLAGFEPAHAGIKIRCLTAWRQPNNYLNGGDKRGRTADLRSASASLSQLSYIPINGAFEWTRTTDLTLIRRVL